MWWGHDMGSRRIRALRGGVAASAALAGLTVGGLTVTGVTVTGLSAGLAAPDTASGTPRPPTVVARGLDNPRHLTAGHGGELLVAEAGRGGSDSCGQGPEGPICYGHSGAITRVYRDGQSRIVTGLPSSAAPETGGGASGPADVARTSHRRLAVLLGFGGPPAGRAPLGAAYAQLGTLLEVDQRTGRRRVTADPLAFEAAANPHPALLDTNPTDLERTRRGWAITDAGGNHVAEFGRRAPRLLAVLADGSAEAPALPGQPAPPPGTRVRVESVPTAAVRGPDGALYVGELTGFPFPRGGATIWRVLPGKKPTPYATGLTNVTDLAWAGRTLYAVQLADNGLFPPTGGLPQGSIRKIRPGASSHPAIASGLTAPYGIAISRRTAYVTTCAMCAGQGQVLAVPLR